MTDGIKDGGAAFPRPFTPGTSTATHDGRVFHQTRCEPAEPGMSLRDYFAGQVAPVLVANLGKAAGIAATPHEAGLGAVAQASYALADAMLTERNKAQEGR